MSLFELLSSWLILGGAGTGFNSTIRLVRGCSRLKGVIGGINWTRFVIKDKILEN